MTRQEEMIAGLRGSGYRQTPQRLAIVRILSADPTHPTVEQVFHQVQKDFPTTSLATVYKTIDTLKELGEVQELEFTDGGRRYDAMNVTPHAHLICRDCDAIEDYDIQVERLRKRAEEASTYELTDTRVDFYGRCKKCRGKATKKSSARSALVGAR
jgi:Fur family peroxide stress response transcriptional regulator